MEKGKNYYDSMMKVLSNPVKPVKPDEEILDTEILFPDKDMTEEEVQEYLNS